MENTTKPTYTHTWYWRKYLPDYKGKKCAILVCGKRNNVLLEFEDGYRVVTCRRGLRRIAPRVQTKE